MKAIICIILIALSLNCVAQNTYFVAATSTSFTIGRTTYPLNTVSMQVAGDTTAIGFSYALDFSSPSYSRTIIAPANYSRYYTVPSLADTVYFASSKALQTWFTTNAVSASGSINMAIGETVSRASASLPLGTDASGNLSQYSVNPWPTAGQYVNATPGVASTFTVTIPSGHSYCTATSATPSVIVVTGCSISSTTMTITTATASVGGASVTLNYFYK